MKTIPQDALGQHMAIIGKTGSGKTWAAKTIVEQFLAASRQVCIIDPTGAWYGLRVAADGKGIGFDVVLLGGKHADIPLSARSGEAVARLVTQQRASVVIDTTGLTVADYTRFFIDFAGTLYTTIKSPLHLVIDEAHNFMPQGKVPDPQAGQMLHAGNRLMSGGRSLGIRGMLITQRPQKLHKDSLTCADTLIAMRVISPQDRGAVKDWIDGAGDPAQGRMILDSLASMPRGVGWVWYPEGGFLERMEFPKIKTYDSSATPKDGATAGPQVREIKLDEVKAALAEAVKEAEANDPKLLRAEIAKLRKELAAKHAQGADPNKAIEKAVSAAVAQRDREWQAAVKLREDLIAKYGRSIDKAITKLGEITGILTVNGSTVTAGPSPQNTSGETRGSGSVTAPSRTPQAGVLTNASTHLAKSPGAAPVRRPGSRASADGTGLGKAERAILIAIYWIRDEEVTPAKVGFYSDYTAGSGSFNNALGRLRSSGLLNGWHITEAGIQAAEELGADDKPSGNELREWLRRKLSKAENALLDALCEVHPELLTVEELGQASGYTAGSGSFNNALGKLRSIEAAKGYARDGGVRAADVFFE